MGYFFHAAQKYYLTGVWKVPILIMDSVNQIKSHMKSRRLTRIIFVSDEERTPRGPKYHSRIYTEK